MFFAILCDSPIRGMGNNYPRVVEGLAAGVVLRIVLRSWVCRFVEVRFTGRGAHRSLDLVEIYEMSSWTFV